MNVAGNGLANVVDEKGGRGVDGNIERSLTAGDLLDQTTHLIENDAVRSFIGRVMSTVVVRNGLLEVDGSGFAERIDLGDVRRVINDLNVRLIEAGDSLKSLLDLERAMELYGTGGIEVPEVGLSELTETAGTATLSVSNPGEYEYTTNGSSATSSTFANSNVQAGINCPTLKAHWPHQSTHQPGYIVGNGSGGCIYVVGPPEQLTYKLFTYLEKKKKLWIFTLWIPVDSHISQKEGINLDPDWKQRETVAKTPCSSGPADFRTRLNLYITGSTLGPFDPHPGTYMSRSVNVACSSR